MLIDNAGGMFPTKEVYSDLDIDKLETLAPTQPHRNVDLALVKADTEGLLPSMFPPQALVLIYDRLCQNTYHSAEYYIWDSRRTPSGP